MSRDHKNTPKVKPAGGTSSNSQSGGGLFTGIVIGLLLGVVISVSVVYFVNKKMMNSPTPSLKPAEPVASSLPKPSANGVSSGEEATASEATPKSKYDFFDILPGTEATPKPIENTPVTPEAAAKTEKNDAAAVPTDKPAANKSDQRQDNAAQATEKKPDEKKVVSRSIFQLGSFQNEADADNLKAKLAILGVEATVRSKDIPGKGLWHRVMAGPFTTPEEADKVKALLQQNGINPSVITLK